MADNIKKIIEIEFSVNNGPVEKFSGNIEQVTKKVEDLEKAISTIPDAKLNLKVDGAEKSIDDIKKIGTETGKTAEQTKSLKQQYREAVAELGKYEEGTKAYEIAAARAGKLADKIEDNSKAITANKSALDTGISALTGVAAGFSVATSAAALFGGENENVQKALLKVQAAMNLVTSLNQLKDSMVAFSKIGDGFTKLSNTIGSSIASVFGFGSASATAAAETELLATANEQNATAVAASVAVEEEAAAAATLMGEANAAATIETEALGVAGATAGVEVAAGMEAAAVGAEGFAAALTATGIGAIIVAIGVAIAVVAAYWDDIKEAVSGVSQEQRNALKAAQENSKTQQEALDTLNAQDETLKASGKSENEILELKRKQTIQVIEARKQELEKAQALRKSQIEAEQRNKDILQGIIRFISAPITILLSTIDLIGKAIGKDFGLEEKFSGGLAGLVFDPEDTKKKGEAADKETQKQLTALQNTADGYANKQKENNKKAADDAKKKAEEYNKKIQDMQKKHNEDMLKLQNDQIAAQNKLNELNADTNIEKENTRYKTSLDALKASKASELLALKEKEDALAKLKAEGSKKNDSKILELEKGLREEKAAINNKYDKADEAATIEHNDNLNNIYKDSAQKRAKLESELRGQTFEEALKDLDIANEAEREALMKAGLDKEKIDKLFVQRRKALISDFGSNEKKLQADKEYYDELAKIYANDLTTYKEKELLKEKLDEDRIKKSLEAELKANQDKMAGLDKDTPQYQQLAAANSKIQADLLKNDVDRVKKAEDEKKKARKDSYEQAKKLATGLADLASALLDVETKKIEKEYDKRTKALKAQNDKQLSNQELTDSQKEELQRESDIKLAALEEEKAAKLKEIQKKQADIQLAITLAQIVASTAEAIMAVTAEAALAAPLLIPGIIAVGAVQAATAVAQRQAIQGLAKGGMVYGAGTETSDSVPAMLSNGEAVINAKAVKKFAPVLSAINQSTGGAPIRPHFAAGGVVPANPGEVSVTNIQDIAAITGQNAVRAYILQSDVTSSSVKNERILRNSRIK